jgi:hypothetical protein
LYKRDQNSIYLITATSPAQSSCRVVVNHMFSTSKIPISVSLLTLIAGKFTDHHGRKSQICGPGSQPRKPEKPRPHICKTCFRPFARLEHLQRHERLHTKEKPFRCQTCMRRFARKDIMLRHKRKIHVTSPTPPRLGGDSTESTTLYPVICDRICGRSIHHSVNSALSEKLIRDVALNADIIHHTDSSNSGLTKVADSHLSFCTVEGLENLTRYSHIDGTSSAWSLLCSDGSQALTATGRWKSYSGLYEDDEHTAYDSTISDSLAKPQAVGRVTGSNIGKLFEYGTEANAAKLYLDGNAGACGNASTLQSWTPESMWPGLDERNDCMWTTEWKLRQPYEHGSTVYGDTTVPTWNNLPCSWETLLEQHSSQASPLQAQPSYLHPCGLAASVHAVLPNWPNEQENAMGYYFDETMVLRDIPWFYLQIPGPSPLGARRKASRLLNSIFYGPSLYPHRTRLL